MLELLVVFTIASLAYNAATADRVKSATALYPGPFVRVDGTLVAYRHRGRHGSPVVLIGGFIEPSDVWRGVGKRLGRRHRVFALDCGIRTSSGGSFSSTATRSPAGGAPSWVGSLLVRGGCAATPREHRGRGYGAAVTAAAARDAFSAGAEIAWLQSSARGHSLYQHLGFRDVETYVLHTAPEAIHP